MQTNVYVNMKEINEDIADYFDGKDLVTIDELLDAIDTLLYEVKHLQEEMDDYKKYVEDNYNPIPYSEQVCVSDRDFIWKAQPTLYVCY